MMELVMDLSAMFEGIEPKWGALAQDCAATCTSAAYACRSLQVTRLLVPHIRRFAVDDLLVRLAESVAAREDEVRAYTHELLLTLNEVVRATCERQDSYETTGKVTTFCR